MLLQPISENSMKVTRITSKLSAGSVKCWLLVELIMEALETRPISLNFCAVLPPPAGGAQIILRTERVHECFSSRSHDGRGREALTVNFDAQQCNELDVETVRTEQQNGPETALQPTLLLFI